MKKSYPKEIPVKGRVRLCLDLIKNFNLKGKVLVDVGCSFGWLEKEILKLNPKKIIGIDPEKNALAFARKNACKAEFIEGSATAIPLPDSVADMVILFDVIEHIPENKELIVLKEIYRILKKEGTLLFSTPNANFLSNIFDPAWYFGHKHYRKEFIRKILEKSGFSINQIYIRGNLWSSIYLFWFYFVKHILRVKIPKNIFFEKKDDESFSKNGFHTIFLVAQKTHLASS